MFFHASGADITTDQARSQVRKRGGFEKKKKCGPKVGVGHQKGEGAGGEVPPPAFRAEAFENIDLATQKN